MHCTSQRKDRLISSCLKIIMFLISRRVQFGQIFFSEFLLYQVHQTKKDNKPNNTEQTKWYVSKKWLHLLEHQNVIWWLCMMCNLNALYTLIWFNWISTMINLEKTTTTRNQVNWTKMWPFTNWSGMHKTSLEDKNRFPRCNSPLYPLAVHDPYVHLYLNFLVSLFTGTKGITSAHFILKLS